MGIFRCNRGVSAVELGLFLPVFMLLLLGTIEVGRYTLMHQKLDKATNAMADYVTQNNAIRFVDMDNFVIAARQIVKPFDYNGTIIFSAAYLRVPNDPPCSANPHPCIRWQYRPIGSDASHIGSVGDTPTLPNNYIVSLGEVVVVSEMFMDYAPLFPLTSLIIPTLVPHKIYKIAIYKPRQVGALINPPT